MVSVALMGMVLSNSQNSILTDATIRCDCKRSALRNPRRYRTSVQPLRQLGRFLSSFGLARSWPGGSARINRALIGSDRSHQMRLGLPEVLVILFIILLIFGANRIPQLMRGIGKGVKEFKDATKEPDEKSIGN